MISSENVFCLFVGKCVSWLIYSQIKYLNFKDEEDDDDYVEEGEEEEEEGELY